MFTRVPTKGEEGFVRTRVPIKGEEGVVCSWAVILACGKKTGDAFQFEWCSRLTRYM